VGALHTLCYTFFDIILFQVPLQINFKLETIAHNISFKYYININRLEITFKIIIIFITHKCKYLLQLQRCIKINLHVTTYFFLHYFFFVSSSGNAELNHLFLFNTLIFYFYSHISFFSMHLSSLPLTITEIHCPSHLINPDLKSTLTLITGLNKSLTIPPVIGSVPNLKKNRFTLTKSEHSKETCSVPIFSHAKSKIFNQNENRNRW